MIAKEKWLARPQSLRKAELHKMVLLKRLKQKITAISRGCSLNLTIENKELIQ